MESVRILLLILLYPALLFLVSCNSQKKVFKKADMAYEIGEYHKAIEYYKKGIELTKENKKLVAESYFKIAECYKSIDDSKNAERYYKRSIKKKNKNPEAALFLGQQYIKNGKIEEATEAFNHFLKLQPNDSRGKTGLESCSLAVAWNDTTTRYKIENIRDLNSKYDDFAPAYADGQFNLVYYTSTRPDIDPDKEKKGDIKIKKDQINQITGVQYTGILESRLDRQGEWSDPIYIEDTIMNSAFDDGVGHFSADFNTYYYTSCPIEDFKHLGCQIYAAQKKGTEWRGGKVQAIVGDSISVGHPSVSADGLVMYFASHMQGGFGGSDIWKVTRSSADGQWGRPVNAGSQINSSGDEAYPFIRQDGNLYFSSDYWLGMGGMDIFKAVPTELGDWEVSNMMAPVNSIQDDYGIVFQGGKEIGLFSSSRKGGRGKADIYSFELPELKFFVEGVLLDKSDKKPLEGVKVTLYASDGSTMETTSNLDGSFKFKLAQYKDYIILASKKSYLRNKTRVSTNNVIQDKTFNVEIELVTIDKPVDVPNIFYDPGSAELNESSKEALEELAKLLEDNPNIIMEIGAHTDMVGDSTYNMNLSNRRAKSVIDYLNSKGYDLDRLVSKGYGENVPAVLDEATAKLDSSFVAGQTLNPQYIESLQPEAQDKANQINRRTQLRILSTDYIPKPEFFLRMRKQDAFN